MVCLIVIKQNNCHAVLRSLSSGASGYDCTMGFYLIPYCQPNPPTRFLPITAIGMCHLLPVHHFGMACLAWSEVNIQHQELSVNSKNWKPDTKKICEFACFIPYIATWYEKKNFVHVLFFLEMDSCLYSGSKYGATSKNLLLVGWLGFMAYQPL